MLSARAIQRVATQLAATIVLALAHGGCTVGCPDGSRLTTGMDEQAVVRKIGSPDVVEERSGAIARLYVPADPPKEIREVQTTVFYYMPKDLSVVFRNGRVSDCSRISAGDLDALQFAGGMAHSQTPLGGKP